MRGHASDDVSSSSAMAFSLITFIACKLSTIPPLPATDLYSYSPGSTEFVLGFQDLFRKCWLLSVYGYLRYLWYWHTRCIKSPIQPEEETFLRKRMSSQVLKIKRKKHAIKRKEKEKPKQFKILSTFKLFSLGEVKHLFTMRAPLQGRMMQTSMGNKLVPGFESSPELMYVTTQCFDTQCLESPEK